MPHCLEQFLLKMKKRGAMEMSVGTIVTIVLLMAVLVLGIFLVQKIFKSATGAVDSIDSEVQSEIRKLFAEEGSTLAIYPTSRQITLKKEDDPKGFAFSVRNAGVESQDFAYTIRADPNFDFTKCGSSFREEQANNWLIVSSGSFSLGPGNELELPELVLFSVPPSAPPCTIPYRVDVEIDGESYVGTKIFVTIK